MASEGKFVGYAWAVAATVAATLAGLAMAPYFAHVNIAMVYLLAVVAIALRFSRGAAIVTSVLCVLAFDVLFVPPVGAFTVDDVEYLLTFAIMLGVGLVISSLMESTRRQARAQNSLEMQAETERIRSTLLASLSHDLRTPLAVMTGASSTLAERGEAMTPEERRAFAGSILHQSREMSEHVNKLLQMTRLDSGDVHLERDWAALDEIAGTVIARLAHRLEAHRLVVELPPDLPLVRVDAALIEQVLANLLENAARHTPAGTVVRLRAQVGAGELVVSVEDGGVGLAAQDLERVFSKFHRGTVEAGEAGMGLGLAICRAIVQLHGGRVWAERLSLGGTAFRFALPLEAAPSMPVEAAT